VAGAMSGACLPDGREIWETVPITEVDFLDPQEQVVVLDSSSGTPLLAHLAQVERAETEAYELLLWWALPGERHGNWAAAIIAARARLEDLVVDSPSLHAMLADVMTQEYPWARSKAQDPGAGMVFPATCPFAVAQLVDETFFPEAVREVAG